MNRARLLVIGGFLGAGKTTALLRLAREYQERGLRVGLITNDQAAQLVDTGTMRVQGFRVEEVAGACFCCKFDDLARAAEKIRADERPDILLGEPVGSCTDLAATVVAPLRKLHGDRYEVAPYSVLVDPTRARQIVLERGFGGFSAKVAYIFQKQLEEADVIGLNKVDLLAAPARAELVAALRREFPRAAVIELSGLTGEGFATWRAALARPAPARANIVAVDYDTYAEGEAELGWLNLTMAVTGAREFDASAIARELVERLRDGLTERGAEVAHLKVLLEADGRGAVANAIGAGTPVRISQQLAAPVRAATLTLNARVHMDPHQLRALADAALARVLGDHALAGVLGEATQLRPGRPVPTHRFADADGA
ncbi:MAG: GTP-binding protein [Planctomycetota bacterium]